MLFIVMPLRFQDVSSNRGYLCGRFIIHTMKSVVIENRATKAYITHSLHLHDMMRQAIYFAENFENSRQGRAQCL